MTETFLTGLHEDAAYRIQELGVPRTYGARSFIFHEGDPGNGVFIVDSGLLRIDRTTSNGRVALLDLAMRGSLIGELSVIDGAARSASLSTITECVVRFVPADAFQKLLSSDSAIQTALIARLTRRLRALSTQFLETSTMNAPARIAASLVRLIGIEQALGQLGQDLSGTIALKLPISQEELGQWSGLTREGAVKGLSALRSSGLIETGRKQVLITNVEGLMRTARDD